MSNIRLKIVCATMLALGFSFLPDSRGADSSAARFPWQETYAKVLPAGDLEWAPLPFKFEKGDSVRYIDFEKGSDDNDGSSKDKPWKHHPWDPVAVGKAKECKGIHTYVFKRGSIYRGRLIVSESGEPGNPIRLTSDPFWGTGEACFYGSQKVGGWQKGGSNEMPEKEKVWHAELGFAPRLVCVAGNDGTTVRLNLARTPNWKPKNIDNYLGECWSWENPEWWKGNKYKGVAGKSKVLLGMDKKNLTQGKEYYQDALVWTEWGIVMGSPIATKVENFDPEKKELSFMGPWYGDSGQINTNHRYWLEDKAQYLDEAGEFWFDKKGDGGTLYVRLPGGADPNSLAVEAAEQINLIEDKASAACPERLDILSQEQKLEARGIHDVHISGLTFRFCNMFWRLDHQIWMHSSVDNACVRFLGACDGIRVSNCRFEYAPKAVRFDPIFKERKMDNILISDNEIREADHGAISVSSGSQSFTGISKSSLGNVMILRNYMADIGFRPIRPNGHMALAVNFPETATISGNILERCGGAGLFIFGGKAHGQTDNAPFNRIVIHNNKVVNSLLIANDWGGIETWQGGPFYVYNNVSGNALGPMNWGGKTFGHAYYLDGSFKNYHFNNIAFGKNNDSKNARFANCAAFQEIHSYQNTFFNNTVYKFLEATRRQAPHAGRDKFISIVFDDVSKYVFRHSDKEGKDPNARDAGAQAEHFDYPTNVYTKNIFFGIGGKLAVFEAEGGDYADAKSFSDALAKRGTMAADGGILVASSPLRNPAKGDFRLSDNSAAIGMGSKVFVPWALYDTVGEWPFFFNPANPAKVEDEHWNMKTHMADREKYYKSPMYPLAAVNVKAADYVEGQLEDWTKGALKLNGKDQHLTLANYAEPETKKSASQHVEGENGWLVADVPGSYPADEPFNLSLKIKGVPDGSKLSVDVNCVKGNSFGGFLCPGGRGVIKGEEPCNFQFKLPNTPGVTQYVLTIYASPDGSWNKKTHSQNINIQKEGAIVRFDPQITDSNFLIEAFLKIEKGANGVIAEKMADAGYSLSIAKDGKIAMTLKSGGEAKDISSSKTVNNGQWHHIIAESDRKAGTMTIYLDGAKDASGQGLPQNGSLANKSDLFVGGTPQGRNLSATFDFLRISRGTLADAKTSIEELYAWQFDGPFLRDFCGVKPTGKRDAGALDYVADK